MKLPGSPDIVFTKYKVAIFIDGCFWHGCPVCYKEPKSNIDLWRNKLIRNQARDDKVNKKLKEEGWAVIRIWSHSIKDDLADCVQIIKNILDSKNKG